MKLDKGIDRSAVLLRFALMNFKIKIKIKTFAQEMIKLPLSFGR